MGIWVNKPLSWGKAFFHDFLPVIFSNNFHVKYFGKIPKM
ncbi:hypothetical protein D1BOALGB6SA_3882 [Olavius sp. associated proteobacterium Delta 1]|nr:hypothetical protein D1BOALGB6SA_3882 [Olavius sp. associated proteobacterium Delta 1]